MEDFPRKQDVGHANYAALKWAADFFSPRPGVVKRHTSHSCNPPPGAKNKDAALECELHTAEPAGGEEGGGGGCGGGEESASEARSCLNVWSFHLIPGWEPRKPAPEPVAALHCGISPSRIAGPLLVRHDRLWRGNSCWADFFVGLRCFIFRHFLSFFSAAAQEIWKWDICSVVVVA